MTSKIITTIAPITIKTQVGIVSDGGGPPGVEPGGPPGGGLGGGLGGGPGGCLGATVISL